MAASVRSTGSSNRPCSYALRIRVFFSCSRSPGSSRRMLIILSADSAAWSMAARAARDCRSSNGDVVWAKAEMPANSRTNANTSDNLGFCGNALLILPHSTASSGTSTTQFRGSTSATSTSTATERMMRSMDRTIRECSFLRTRIPSIPASGPQRTRTRRPILKYGCGVTQSP